MTHRWFLLVTRCGCVDMRPIVPGAQRPDFLTVPLGDGGVGMVAPDQGPTPQDAPLYYRRFEYFGESRAAHPARGHGGESVIIYEYHETSTGPTIPAPTAHIPVPTDEFLKP